VELVEQLVCRTKEQQAENPHDKTMMQTLHAILYELQPIRPSDAAKLISFAWRTVRDAWQLVFVVGSNQAVQGVLSLSLSSKSVFYICTALCGLIVAGYFKLIDLFFILLISTLIFFNGFEERKANEQSAYSVFNKSFKRLLGTTTAEQFDNEIRNQNPGVAQQGALQDISNELREIAADIRAKEEAERKAREEVAEMMRAEIAGNEYRRKRGKKARRNNEKVKEKVSHRRQGVQADENNELDVEWEDDLVDDEAHWEQWIE